MEEWRNIEEYANYQVSDLGNMVIILLLCKVHRLVAKAFLPNYSDNLQVNHKDEVKTNNDVYQ